MKSTTHSGKWSNEDRERAAQIVNDIAEDIDNGENRQTLRRALAIYADLLADKHEDLVSWHDRENSRRLDLIELDIDGKLDSQGKAELELLERKLKEFRDNFAPIEPFLFTNEGKSLE